MKIFRADLQVVLDNKFFEISGESLGLDSVQLTEDKIECTIHSEQASRGYYLKGKMAIAIQNSCDRCLIDFGSKQDIPFSILLTSDRDLISNDEHDVIYYTEQEDAVDISPVLVENILLDRPLKKLCSADCKGLCPTCGCNKNEQECACPNEVPDSRWDVLKHKLI